MLRLDMGPGEDGAFRISKREVADRTLSSVERITDEARIDELAAMLDGVPSSYRKNGG